MFEKGKKWKQSDYSQNKRKSKKFDKIKSGKVLKKQLHFRKFQLIFYFSEKSTKILKFRKLQLILLIS